MINISKTIIVHLRIALKKAFNLPADVSCTLIEGKYVSKVAQDFSQRYKAQNTKIWRETLYPKDIAQEILINLQPIFYEDKKLIDNIRIDQNGHIIFTINEQYYARTQEIVAKYKESPSNRLIQPIFGKTRVIGPFIGHQVTSTCLRGLSLASELSNVLTLLGEGNEHFVISQTHHTTNNNEKYRIKKIKDIQLQKQDYVVVPAKLMDFNNPYQWGYNYSSYVGDNQLFNDPWIPQFRVQELEPILEETYKLIADLPSILEDCLNKKSLKEYMRFKQQNIL